MPITVDAVANKGVFDIVDVSDVADGATRVSRCADDLQRQVLPGDCVVILYGAVDAQRCYGDLGRLLVIIVEAGGDKALPELGCIGEGGCLACRYDGLDPLLDKRSCGPDDVAAAVG